MINGRYKISGKAGEGRSSVYLCEDTLQKDSRLAIKILPPSVDEDEKKAFRDEYFLLQKLSHPNIISVFDYGEVVSLDEYDKGFNISAGSPFFTLEYFDGVELYETKNPDNENILIEIICQISSVLYYLHQSGYIYYDLKSENILVREQNNVPVIKFIDFGFAARVIDTDDNSSAKGTSEYIAPEILKKERLDHRVDLYSLGILLYKILYGEFPFSATEQLEIYKAHLNEEFEFPGSSFSEKLVNLVKVLLSKNPEERYYTSIGVINETAPERLKELKKDWKRIPVFTARNDALSILLTYLEQGDGGEVLAIKGAEGAGKTTLLQELNYKYPFSIMLSADQRTEGNIWQLFLRKLLYQPNIYPGIHPDTIIQTKKLLNGKSTNLVEEIKTVVIKLISSGRFILLIDNYNLISNFDLDIFKQIIPVLQVNKIKVVLTEDSSTTYRSQAINGLRGINLNPFTETEVTEFVQKSFAGFYPREEIKKAIIIYSDLLPGNIEIFLRDLIVLDILKFAAEGPSLKMDNSIDEILKGSHEDIYRFRFNNIDEENRELAIFLSLFNVNSDIRTITLLTDQTEREISIALIKLSEANIIHLNPVLGIIQFTSRGIKDYIYSTIRDHREAHLKTAQLISGRIPDFNRNELARHWEAAEEYELTYEVLKDELALARNVSALAYERSLLEHLSGLPLKQNSLKEAKIALSNCLFRIGEHQASLGLINELLKYFLSPEEEISLKILKGKALISSQNLEEGKELLESILTSIESDESRNEILAEIAEAEFEMANYEEAVKLTDKLVAEPAISANIKGKLYRIKGLIELFKNNDPGKTIECFEDSLKYYEQENMIAKVATMENNLGNIFNIALDKKKAEYHWKESIKLNESIGNLLQNGINLMSNGIYNFENCNFEKAVEQYLAASSIFKTLGDKNNQGINFINMGEVYLMLCEYEKAMDILQKASNIFDSLENRVEQGEAEFLLGKLYYALGDTGTLYKAVEKYSKYPINLEKTGLNYSYLQLLYDLLIGESKDIGERLLILRNKSGTLSDSFLFCEIQIKIIEQLLKPEQSEEAMQELSLEEFVEKCEEHTYYDAYRHYLTGKVISLFNDKKAGPFLDHYEKAYELIGGISITELTWKILFELYLIYNERGNISRMSEFRKYAIQTIYYIADQFKSAELRKKYIEGTERRNVLHILEGN